ncbi:CoA-binding protein [Legionella erythra]|uniref:CoA-binding protein n=1 Tax=Legionella erythra TaxID=448 RepID=A0A0W0TSM6_LEGER|nr:CoA-binding protein [Legionella erythra]KTC98410.1 CoA-binding protein [Legionella erythra]
MEQAIVQFFTSEAYAVIGASNDRTKFGNKVLRCYLQHHKKVYPVHPMETLVEGLAAVKTVRDLPDTVKSISIVTPPAVTEKVMTEAIARGIDNVWMQPGAESRKAINDALQHGLNVIAEGPCILVALGCSLE